MLGLYVHIPFCEALCSYCNFNRGLFDADLKARYLPALEREIRSVADRPAADTVFFGGGTPSLLEPGEIAKLLGACREACRLDPGAEVTLETNPESVTPARIAGFLDAGVTRLSFGVQTFDDRQLRDLGRIHSAATAVRAVAEARAAGAGNISLDLMCWLPGQSRASWRDSVSRAIALGPDHLSFYLLELYPNAPLRETLARDVAAGRPGLASDDEAADMYLEGLALLDDAGYRQYEISNVARPGCPSRHNLKYWTMGDWRGFGCGAHSTVGDRRWRNVAATTAYIDQVAGGGDPAVGGEVLTADDRAAEAVFTGLRLVDGVDGAAIEARFGRDPLVGRAAELAGMVEAGLAWQDGRRVGLTRRGMLVSTEVLARLV